MKIRLSNDYEMPCLLQGLPLLRDYRNQSRSYFYNIVSNSVRCGVSGFDTSHDYGKSEKMLGVVLKKMFSHDLVKRSELFITTKIGNGQQIEGNIEEYVDTALQQLKLDYIDLMLLHWPYPGKYITNWKKLEHIYKSGKIKAIGLANVRERHLKALLESGIEIVPHVVQVEYHPFFSQPEFMDYCKSLNIAIQAYSPLVQMIPLVTTNRTLKDIALTKGKSIPQIILRWVIQNAVTPIFRSYNVRHIQESADVFSFALDSNEMDSLNALNINYKFHPESLNCPGY